MSTFIVLREWETRLPVDFDCSNFDQEDSFSELTFFVNSVSSFISYLLDKLNDCPDEFSVLLVFEKVDVFDKLTILLE